MKIKETVLIASLILLTSITAAEINFRSDQPIDFYNDINVRGNDITEFFNEACGEDQAVKDVYNNGSFECAPAGGLDTAVEVNNTLIRNIDANGYQITGLQKPQEQGEAATWEWSKDNFVSLDGDTMLGNLDLNNNNITSVNTLKFTSGFRINGSLNTSGGNINLDNGSLNDVYAIEGEGSEVNFLDAIDMNGNQIRDSNGSLEIEGEVYLPNGNLDMAGNNIINPGNVDGVDLDNPGRSIQVQDSKYQIKTNGIGNQEINNTQQITVNGLKTSSNINITGNNIEDVSRIIGEENLGLSGEGDSQGVVLEKGDGTNLLEAGISDNNIEIPNGNLDLTNGNLKIDGGDGTNYVLKEYGNGIQLTRDGSGNSEFNLEPGVTELGTSKVEITSGNLDTQGNSIVDTTSSNSIPVGDGSDDSISLNAGGQGTLTVETGDASGSSTQRLQVTSSSGQADINIQNSDLDLNGNSIKNYYDSTCPSGETMVNINDDGSFDCVSVANEVSDVYVNRSGDSMTGDLDMRGNQIQDVGKAGVNTANPQEDLDVDGTASVENAGTEMKVDSNGNVVVSLGQ